MPLPRLDHLRAEILTLGTVRVKLASVRFRPRKLCYVERIAAGRPVIKCVHQCGRVKNIYGQRRACKLQVPAGSRVENQDVHRRRGGL